METPNQIWNTHIFGFFSEFLKELKNFEENYERNKDDESGLYTYSNGRNYDLYCL